MRIFGVKTEVSAYALIYLAAAVVLIPLKWLAAMLLASGIHELGHLLMLYALKIPVQHISIGLSGAQIRAGGMTAMQEFCCACAGPAAGALLLCCGSFYPELAICAFVQSIYNLVPILPFDGGRMLRCLVNMIFPKSMAGSLLGIAKWVMVTGALVAVLFFLIRGLVTAAIFCTAIALLFCLKRKIACKGELIAVQ